MPTTPINALPSPDGASPNLPPIHFDALNAQLDSRLVARFASAQERDTKITSPQEGMECRVAGAPQTYFNGGWRSRRAILSQQRQTHGSVGRATAEYTPLGVFYTLPDPGVPYRLKLTYFGPSNANGCQMRVSVVHGPTTTQDNVLPAFYVINNYSNLTGLDLFESRISDELTGARRIGAFCQRVSASGDWFLNPGYLDIEVISSW